MTGVADLTATVAGPPGDDARRAGRSVAAGPQQGRVVPAEGSLPPGEAAGVAPPHRHEGQRRE